MLTWHIIIHCDKTVLYFEYKNDCDGSNMVKINNVHGFKIIMTEYGILRNWSVK